MSCIERLHLASEEVFRLPDLPLTEYQVGVVISSQTPSGMATYSTE